MNNPNTNPIRYFCDLNPGTGYNIAARGMLAVLNECGYSPETLRCVPAILADFHASEISAGDRLQDYTHGDWAGGNSQDKINIVHLNPGAVGDYYTPLAGRYNIAVTTWETDRLPKVRKGDRTVVGDLNKFDEIWVPTEWVAGVFKASGVEKPVFVVPHALLPELLAVPPAPKRPGNGSDTVFYYMGSWNARKAPEVLLRAYFAVGFKPTHGAQLQMYCVPPTRDPRWVQEHSYQANEAVMRIRKALPDPHVNVPPHGLHTTFVDYATVLDRHRHGDVFVSASRGEGFSLCALEAAAFGNWIIGGGPWLEELARVAGHLDDDSGNGLVDLLHTELGPVESVPDCAGYELDQQWWLVRQKELSLAIKAAFLARKEAGAHNKEAAAKRVRDYYAPASIARHFVKERLEAIATVLEGSGW